jgi:hypothetical protein
MKKIIVGIFLIALCQAAPAFGMEDDRLMTDRTKEVLQNTFQWDDVMAIFINCADRPTCGFFLKTRGIKRVEVGTSDSFPIDMYVPESVDDSAYRFFALYFDEDGVDVGDTLVMIDAKVNPFDKLALKAVKELVQDAFTSVEANDGPLFWLGKIYINDGIWLKAMVHQNSTHVNDYTLRFIFSYTDVRGSFGTADSLNQFFLDAVYVFLITDEPAVKTSILAVGKVAASLQRASMREYLSGQIESLRGDNPEFWKDVIEKIMEIEKELGAREWTLEDIYEEKKRLREHDEELATALDEADASIFRRRYPDLFPGKVLQ